MPTAAKLVAAAILAVTGWFCAELIKPLMEEGRDLSKLSPICAAVGLVVGWKYLGPRADRRLGSVGANAFTTALVQTGLTLFIFAFTVMIKQSLRKAYDGPIEALQDIFMISVDFFQKYFTFEVIGAVLLGGALASWCAINAARKWG
ncbi:TrgA family protein [Aliiroseovarius sp. S1339]|uniref:TrgA family protein n=1 Tax=Aliiroseovarius sp. S1339 TaxID=2936990 RepID=UPI0020C036F8|nr:TrgA family protein [Aliiroseovarius sp. S1339]MCK8463803.1 TrgA family protein [Aliiroseovarius sp. S1339]